MRIRTIKEVRIADGCVPNASNLERTFKLKSHDDYQSAIERLALHEWRARGGHEFCQHAQGAKARDCQAAEKLEIGFPSGASASISRESSHRDRT
jgi:hypothetical protein